MIITRYEITMNGKNTVGLIQGGYGLDLLSDQDLKQMNNKLTIPKIKHKNPNFEYRSFFTEEGLQLYKSIIDTAIKNLKDHKLELKIIEKRIDLNVLDKKQIVYTDKWQVTIIENPNMKYNITIYES